MFAMGPAFFGQGGVPTLVLSGAFAAATQGVAYSSSIAITGGVAPYSLTGGTGIASGSLPAGLSLSISGSNLVLSGTPTTAATSTFTASVDSADAQTATSAQSVTVAGKWYDALFASGEQGMVVDFNDLTTLWQDTSHTVPVTTVGDPINCAQCKRTGAYGVANSGSATLAYDATHAKFYAAANSTFNMVFAGAVPTTFLGNALISMVAVASYTSTSQTIAPYIGPAYPTNPSNGNGIGLIQILDGVYAMEYLMFGSGRGIRVTPASGLKVMTGTKRLSGSTYLMTVYNGITSVAGDAVVSAGNIISSGLNLDLGRAGGTAQSLYCFVAIDRTLTYAEITAYNVAGQAL